MVLDMVVRFAYKVNASHRYKKIKNCLNNLFNNSNYPYKKFLDWTMVFLIVSSIGILVYEVRYPLPAWMDIYVVYIVTFVFLIEYLLRFWIYSDFHTVVIREFEKARFLKKPFSIWTPVKIIFKSKAEYMFSPSAIIDLLAILPAYRSLSILRIFVLFRVFKLLRYTKSINQFVEVLSHKRFELFTLLFLLLFIVVSTAIAAYVFEEKENPNINSFFDAFYWAMITISTVGYGDISPVTSEGRLVSVVIVIFGITMISFVTSVIVTAFSEKLGELKESRMIEMINRQESFLIVCGYGQMAKMFLRQNKKIRHHYIVIDKDPIRVEQAHKDGYYAILDDASRYEVISKFNIHSDITVLCLSGSDIENIYISLNVKSFSPKIKVIARANQQSMKKKYELIGVDHVVYFESISNIMLRAAIMQPVLYSSIHSLLTGEDIAHIDEISVNLQSGLIEKEVGALEFNENKLLLIGIQRKGRFIFNPNPQIVLIENDTLLVMGLEMSIAHFKEKNKKYGSLR